MTINGYGIKPYKFHDDRTKNVDFSKWPIFECVLFLFTQTLFAMVRFWVKITKW